MADYGKAGLETQVNVEGDLSQITPFVTSLTDGRYAIAWGTYSSGTTIGAISTRIFNADGSPSTGEIAIAASTGGGMSVSSVAALDGGGFAIGFTESNTQTVRVRLVSASGVPGAEFEPNPSQVTTQFYPEITALANGNFLVNWIQSDGPASTGGMEVFARLHHGDGSPASDMFIVNVQRDSYQSGGKVAALSGGGFAIAWSDYNPAVDGSQNAARLRIYDASGAPVTDEIGVNTTTTGSQTVRDMIALSDGGFVVHYENNQRGGAGQVNSFVQAFDATGAKVGAEVPLAGLAGEIKQLPDGTFVHAYAGDALPAEVHLQRYDADFNTIGAVEYANTSLTGTQAGGEIAVLSNGFVVTYFTGDTSVDGDATAILMQRFSTGATTTPATRGDDVLSAASDDAWLVNGAGGDDALTGAGGDDRIRGGNGGDALSGNAGDDRLFGGAGDDLLFGGSGRDRLDGGAGSDRLFGGIGIEAMIGGAGADAFAFTADDLANAPRALDARILDFDTAAGDRIDLSGLDAALSFIGEARFSGAAGEVRTVSGAGSSVVYADVDGDKLADLVIRLDGAHALTAADFIL